MMYLSRRFHNSAYLLIFELVVLNQNQAYHSANLLEVRFKDNLELAHFVRINQRHRQLVELASKAPG